MKNLTWQNPEQLFVAQELINKVKSKCCGIKVLLFFAAMFMAVGMKAQEPLYVANAQTTSDDELAEWYYLDGFVPTINAKVEVYEGFMIVRAIGGVEGYDLLVEFNEEEAVTSLSPIVNDVEGDVATSGYCTIPTGREDEYSSFNALVSYEGIYYCSAGEEDGEGYIFLCGYVGDKYLGYYLVWPVEEEELPEGCLYKAEGELTTFPEDWEAEGYDSSTCVLVNTKVNVEAYEGYVILRGVAGVEGYDLMVELNEEESVTSLTPIVNGKESDPVTSGYCTFYTGLEDDTYKYFQAYVEYCCAGSYEDESGYVYLTVYNAAGDWVSYFLLWGDDDESSISNISVDAADAAAFNLFGQKVGAEYKGIVIKNGKKMLK